MAGYLTTTEYRNLLTRRRDEILAHQHVPAAERLPDAMDQLIANSAIIDAANELNRNAKELRLINEALDRLDAGDYGECAACSTPIPAKRLNALPWARYCVGCQEIKDAMELVADDGAAQLS